MALTDGLIGLWHVNVESGGITNDESGNNNNMSLSGAIIDTTTKKLGAGSLYGDGINDAGTILNASILEPQNITWSLWYNQQTGGASYNSPFIMGIYPSEPYGFIHEQTTGRVYSTMRTGGGRRQLNYLPTNPFNTWHLINASFNNTTKIYRLYVDGILRGSTTLTGESIIYNNSNIKTLVNNTVFFKGNIDEIGIWNRALTDGNISVGQTAIGEIAELWNGGAGIEIGAVSTSSRRRRIDHMRRLS